MKTRTATPNGYCRCRFPQANLNRYPVRCQTCGRILDAYMLLKARKLPSPPGRGAGGEGKQPRR